MRARQLIDGACFGPTALKVMGEAFDAAWDSIADNFRGDPAQIKVARLVLAQALLSVASEDSLDSQVLKNAALQAMARDYRTMRYQPAAAIVAPAGRWSPGRRRQRT